MRIISKFQDYYDGPSYDWPEDDLVFVRKTEEINLGKHLGDHYHITVGFCGKVFKGINLKYFFQDSSENNFVYSFEEVENFAKNNLSEKQYNLYLGKQPYKNSSWARMFSYDYWRGFPRQQEIRSRFENIKQKKFDEKLNCVCYVSKSISGDHYLIKNPCLKDFQFYKVYDIIAAYQEISMYLGNGRAAREYVPEMDNNTKIEQHGFNLRESFRHRK